MASQLLRDGLWSSKKLRRCSFLAHTMYPYVYLVADQWGRFEWDPEVLQARLFGARASEVPGGYREGTESVPCGYLLGLLFEYETNGLLERYSEGSRVCARWTGYRGLPESKRAKSKLPEPKPDQILGLPHGSNTVPDWYREGTESVRKGSLVLGVVSGLGEGVVVGEDSSAPPAPVLAKPAPKKRKSNYVGLACDLWTEIKGGVIPPGRMGSALKPLVLHVRKRNGIESDDEAWEKIEPWFRSYLKTTDDSYCSPEAFVKAPRSGVTGGSAKARARDDGMRAEIEGGLRDE